MIYFVRHGQTDDNKNGIAQGNKPLNETGVAQAKETAEMLKNMHFDICYCSPLERTKMTMEEILRFHEKLDVVFDERLVERKYGKFVGKSKCEIENYENRWILNEPLAETIETIPEMRKRISSFFDEILPKHKGQNILIVSHSGVARISYAYFNGVPVDGDYTKFKLKNAEVAEFDNDWELLWFIKN